MAELGQDIIKAKQFLEDSKLVAIPTETVYGLAANALDIKAVSSIFETKNRPKFDPLIIHTDQLDKAKIWVKDIPPRLMDLMKEYAPGPITVLLPKSSLIPDLVSAGLERVALRIPNHPLTLKLLESLDFPLAAPSANPFGYVSPTTAQHVQDQLGEKIPYILDGGACKIGLESTIVGIENEEIIIYRKGGLEVEKIEQIVGPVKMKTSSSSNPAAPGMLISHYAPNKKLKLYRSELPENVRKKAGVLAFSEIPDGFMQSDRLCKNEDLQEAAQNLFGKLRSLELWPVDEVFIEMAPEIGLGRAINDRLKRATAHH